MWINWQLCYVRWLGTYFASKYALFERIVEIKSKFNIVCKSDRFDFIYGQCVIFHKSKSEDNNSWINQEFEVKKIMSQNNIIYRKKFWDNIKLSYLLIQLNISLFRT
jgi:hypothetical protein